MLCSLFSGEGEVIEEVGEGGGSDDVAPPPFICNTGDIVEWGGGIRGPPGPEGVVLTGLAERGED